MLLARLTSLLKGLLKNNRPLSIEISLGDCGQISKQGEMTIGGPDGDFLLATLNLKSFSKGENMELNFSRLAKPFVVGALCLAAVVQPMTASADEAGGVIGGVIGGIIGGLVGSDASDGDPAATIAGIIIGGAVGALVGDELEDADRRAVSDARHTALRRGHGSYIDWDGNRYRSRSGARGRITVIREGYYVNDSSLVCREYSSQIWIRGRSEATVGQACVDRYGRWTEVTTTQVVYGRGHNHGRPVPFPGGNGGFDPRPYPPVVYPRPVEPFHREVPDSDVYTVIQLLREEHFDNSRNDVLRQYIQFWNRQGLRLNSYLVADLLETFSFDSGRMDALHTTKRILNVRVSDVERIVDTFTFSSNRDEARRILLSGNR